MVEGVIETNVQDNSSDQPARLCSGDESVSQMLSPDCVLEAVVRAGTVFLPLRVNGLPRVALGAFLVVWTWAQRSSS